MRIRNREIVACISPLMVKDNEHNIIRVPHETRTRLNVDVGDNIRINNRPFKVEMAYTKDLELLPNNIVEDRCVFFSGEFGDNEFINLSEQNLTTHTNENEVTIKVTNDINARAFVFTWCKSSQKLNDDEIYIPAAGRRALGVETNDKVYVGQRGKGLIVKQAYKADLNNFKDIAEDNIIFMSYNAPSTTPLDYKHIVDGLTVDQAIEQINEVFGPDKIKVETGESDAGFNVSLEWDEIVMGGADAPTLKEAFSGAFGELQKQLNDLVKDAADANEKINELSEVIDEE